MCDSGLRGDVGERAITIVAKQVRSRLASDGKALQPRPVHQKNVEPTVVVVIVEGNAAARGFEQIFILVFAPVDRFGVQSGLTCDVEKAHAQIAAVDRRFVSRGSGFLLRRTRSQPARTGHRQHAFQRKHECRTAERFQKNAA